MIMVMRNQFVLLGLLVAIVCLLTGAGPQETVDKEREEANVRAIGVGVLRGGEINVIVSGERAPDAGGGAVDVDDAFHIGSCTKAMTATLAAKYVEAGTLRWDSTLAEVVPELAEAAGESKDVTLLQLLSHTGGIVGGAAEYAMLDNWWQLENDADLSPHQRRLAAAKLILRQPNKAPGEEFLYSNGGYLLAGLMMEAANDNTDFETLMQRDLFQPLGITTAGFGPAPEVAGSTKNADSWTPAYGDNPSLLGPAGTVHLSMNDWLKFVATHLPDSDFLSDELRKTLHKPHADMNDAAGQKYALGWIITPDGKLAHEGSNTFCHAIVVLDVKAERAIAVATAAPDRAASMAALVAVLSGG